jgi:nucleoside-diphosphate-sugar epimerase
MNVLVTGANGLLGHHVVFELLKQQHHIRIIVRSCNNIYFDLSLVDSIKGNFTDVDCLKKAAQGCDAIIHIAAITATDLLHYGDYSKVNVEGSAQIIRIAKELSINTLVYVSSANTIGFGTETQLADENNAIQFPFTHSFYAQSKVASEQLFIQASRKPDQHIIIVNPTFMIGAYDPKPSSGKLMIMGYKRALNFVPKGGKNFVHVTDVAVAVCNAITQGINGNRYLLSGINHSFKEYYTLQKYIGKYKQWIIELPDWVLLVVGKVGDILRKMGIKTEVCSMNLRQLMITEYYNNRKAKLDLNLPETNIEIPIKEAIDWFKEHKMIDL